MVNISFEIPFELEDYEDLKITEKVYKKYVEGSE